MVNLPEIPSSKTLAFVFLGIVLYIGSSYLNILKPDSSNIGVGLSMLLIAAGIAAQIINWLIFWQKKVVS